MGFLDQIKALWGRWTMGQRVAIIGCGVATVVALFLLVKFVSQAEYSDLYTNIDPQEAGRIATKLDDWKQPYKISGTTIKVPISSRDRLRIRLASEKLAPSGGIKGWELFDATKITMTDYERRINYLRALQGELARTIASIEGIEDARVLLVLPKKELFIEEEKPVTCSIKLTMSPFATLEKNQVKGIVNLVSYAVEGLKPENVTLIDNRGNMLSEDLDEATEEAMSAKQVTLQRDEAKRLEKKIREKLGKALGQDKIEVIVKYEMDFDRQQIKKEKYSTPGFEQLKISEEKVQESFKGEGAKPEGAPGVESQIPGYKEMAKAGGPVDYNKNESRINYYVDKEEMNIAKAPAISKISVAALIDGSYETDEKGKIKKEKGKPVYHPRTDDEMEKYRKMIWAAIGAEKGREYIEREYIVEVENVQFDRTQEWLEEEREKVVARKELVTTIATVGVGGGLLLLLGIFIFSAVMAAKKKEDEKRKAGAERLDREMTDSEIPITSQLATEGVLSEEEMAALQTARRKPALVANIIRGWLAEEG